MTITKLQSGTYIREPDGATLLFHSDLTSWNMPSVALKYWQENKHMESFPSLETWRQVTDTTEILDVYKWLGSDLKPGEYFTITSFEVLDYEKRNG